MLPQVHMIWIQGEKNIPDRFQVNLDSWRQLVDIKVWDGCMIRRLIKDNFPQLLKTYDSYPIFVQKVDLGRYVILYLLGGLYLDIDTRPIKENIDSLWERLNSVPEGKIVMPGPNVPYTGIPSMDAKLCNWFIYTPKPRQTFLKKCLDNITYHSRRGRFQLRSYYVSSSTGAIFLTKYFDDTCEIIKVNDVLVNEYAGTWAKLDDHDAVLIAAFIIIILVIILVIVFAARFVYRRFY
jgi:mannosyltransferase OCH1-like enzyme